MGIPRFITEPNSTDTRVQDSTCDEVNERIAENTRASVAKAAVSPAAIERRLLELEREWDIERALQTNFAAITIASVALGTMAAAPWFLLTGIAAGFMGEHALKGWCPPVPILRRLGFRTMREINQERYALKALRGDFKETRGGPPHGLLKAAKTT
jgi:hypothetical protein